MGGLKTTLIMLWRLPEHWQIAFARPSSEPKEKNKQENQV
jgi:hypothetical protein